MPHPNRLPMLMRYTAWANDLLFQSLAKLPEEALVEKRPIVFGSILRTLNHVHAMSWVWRCHLEGVPHGLTTRNPPTAPPFAELREAQAALDAWYVAYAEGLDAAALAEVIDFTFIGGGEGAMSREDILLHVVNHTTYHRGHTAGLMYQIPVMPPTTDLPVFLREYASA
ncbi:DinB family protein [Dyella koreensis]|uniref:DinB family protein n=1 Tax=Dyella koreensis TaxID=311235 RepID=A0ABW8K0C7_9GAMM